MRTSRCRNGFDKNFFTTAPRGARRRRIDDCYDGREHERTRVRRARSKRPRALPAIAIWHVFDRGSARSSCRRHGALPSSLPRHEAALCTLNRGALRGLAAVPKCPPVVRLRRRRPGDFSIHDAQTCNALHDLVAPVHLSVAHFSPPPCSFSFSLFWFFVPPPPTFLSYCDLSFMVLLSRFVPLVAWSAFLRRVFLPVCSVLLRAGLFWLYVCPVARSPVGAFLLTRRVSDWLGVLRAAAALPGPICAGRPLCVLLAPLASPFPLVSFSSVLGAARTPAGAVSGWSPLPCSTSGRLCRTSRGAPTRLRPALSPPPCRMRPSPALPSSFSSVPCLISWGGCWARLLHPTRCLPKQTIVFLRRPLGSCGPPPLSHFCPFSPPFCFLAFLLPSLCFFAPGRAPSAWRFAPLAFPVVPVGVPRLLNLVVLAASPRSPLRRGPRSPGYRALVPSIPALGPGVTRPGAGPQHPPGLRHTVCVYSLPLPVGPDSLSAAGALPPPPVPGVSGRSPPFSPAPVYPFAKLLWSGWGGSCSRWFWGWV